MDILTFKSFPSSAMILLVIWFTNGDGIVVLLQLLKQVPRSIYTDGIERL